MPIFLRMTTWLSTRKIIGAIIGFGGLLVLAALSLFGGVEATTLGLLAVLLAAFCYGVNIVFTRTYLRGLPGLVAPAAQLSMASVLLIPVALLVGSTVSIRRFHCRRFRRCSHWRSSERAGVHRILPIAGKPRPPVRWLWLPT
ncbi:MAG: hypothetical protein R3C26_17760 [Calditrichia bacterium]